MKLNKKIVHSHIVKSWIKLNVDKVFQRSKHILTVSFKACNVFTFLEILAQIFSFRRKAFQLATFSQYGNAIYNVACGLVNNYGITNIWTVAILPKTRKSDLEKIGKLEKLEGIGGQQDYRRKHWKCRKWQMSLMLEDNTNDHNRLEDVIQSDDTILLVNSVWNYCLWVSKGSGEYKSSISRLFGEYNFHCWKIILAQILITLLLIFHFGKTISSPFNSQAHIYAMPRI